MVKRGLGKGLNALIEMNENGQNEIMEMKITDIEPDNMQPRKDFDQEKLTSLCDSIKKYGVIQPIIVTRTIYGMYKIIAGERRWRACKMAGVSTVPVIIKEYSKEESAEISLIENLQRENLNPIEEAAGYKRLMDEFGLTQVQISEKMGKSRSAIANTLRLLTLPENIKDMVIYGELSNGHARTILAITDIGVQNDIAQKIIANDLSVRQTEKLINDFEKDKDKEKKTKKDKNLIAQLIEIQEKFQKKLGTKVKIISGKSGGKIQIEYSDYDELERLSGMML
ncbi:MAG: ParB/RepB/Spo0J family partition protein [Oscillospiraceae bacterium]|nr:ParB/RepB/Spo0J family partition protein [Oscillospiraceae bacterium]